MRVKRISKAVKTEVLFQHFLMNAYLPVAVPEWIFAQPRKWRFDYAWPEYKIALEVEGGIWTRGRHTRGAGFLKDIEKYNAAAALGWLVLRTTPKGLLTSDTVELLRCTMKQRAA